MAPQLVKLRRAARDCEQRLVESLANLRVEDAEYSNLQTAGSVPIETIRASLPEGALLLEYYCVGDTFHACLLSRDSLKIVPVGIRLDFTTGPATAALPAFQIPPGPGIRQTIPSSVAGRH